MRLLGLSIGVTSVAVGIVLAAVFLGMALGSWLAGRMPARWQNRLFPFAVVEAIVAGSALLLLPLLLNLDHILALVPALGQSLWFRFFLVTLLLALPAAGLGAAYPLVASAVAQQNHGPAKGLGHLYALHTAGGVAGALATVLFFIPRWELDGTLYGAALINATVALCAFFIDRKQTAENTKTATGAKGRRQTGSWAGLFVLSITGMSAVATEVGWSKYLSIFAGGTFFGFAALLALFLSGIALGAWAVRPLSRRIPPSPLWLAYGLVALGAAMFITRAGLGFVPAVDDYLSGLHTTSPLSRYAVVLVILFPTAFLFGALFPISLRSYCGEAQTLAPRVGRGYAVNTLAGLAGAAVAGVWLIPAYGTDRLLVMVALMVLAASLLLWPLLPRGSMRTALAGLAPAIMLVGVALPPLDFERLVTRMDASYDAAYWKAKGRKSRFLFLKEGRSGVISLQTYDGENLMLFNNGLKEANISPKQGGAEVLLGLMPHLFRPEAKKAFVVGYGAGMTTEILAASDLASIRVVELEPAVVEAMASLSDGSIPLLQDPRIRLDYNDARNTLLLEPEKYDIIVSQPSHPWRAGASVVFTREFFQIAHSRLKPGGVFGQWLNLFQMDATTLRAVFRAFFEVFPRGVVFASLRSEELVLLGSDTPLVLDRNRIKALLQETTWQRFFTSLEIQRPEDVLKYFLFTRHEALAAAGKTAPNTDMNLLSEIRLAGMQKRPEAEENPYTLLQHYTQRDLSIYMQRH